MTATTLFDLPPDLLAKAAEVPGLSQRLRLFLTSEIVLHEKGHTPASSAAVEIVRQARERAAARRREGFDPAQVRHELVAQLDTLLNESPPS